MSAPDALSPERSPEPQPIETAALAATLARVAAVAVRAVDLVGRLIEAEDATLTNLDRQEADAARAIVDPPSLEVARQAGQDLDDCKVARAAVLPRVTSLVGTCDRAARIVRRTLALQARFMSARPARPFPPFTPAPDAKPARSTPRTPRDPDLEPAERLYDPPERLGLEHPDTGDELGAMTDAETLRSIGRDLSAIAETTTRLAANPDGPPPARTKAPPPTFQYSPGRVPFTILPANPATRPPAPDT